MHRFRSRLALVAALSVLIAGGVVGLAIELAAVDARPGAHPARLIEFGMLTAFAIAAVVCVLLLIRVMSGSERLAAANAELAETNRELAAANAELARAGGVLAARNLATSRATQAKSRFVASMSHELRTPLNAVIGFAELLDQGRGGPLSPRQREYIQIIRASSDHLLTLANDALDMSAIEAGHLRLDPQVIDAAAVAAECVSALRTMARERRVMLSLDPGAPAPVVLDPARLRQVILNYTANAIRFTPAGGHVTVRTSRRDGGLQVEVIDTGIGISAADQARVFDAFVRAGSRAGGGSGLGLAVTRQIVEAQGGEVTVASRPGAGSTFGAWLPAGVAAPQTGAMTAPDLFSSTPAIPLRGSRPRPRRAPDGQAAASR